MLQTKPRPDFRRFIDTLLLRKAYRRPPMFDFHIAPEHKARVIGREPRTAGDDVEFFRLAGYDYVQCTVHIPCRELTAAAEQARAQAATVGSNLNLITSLEQFRGQRWSWQAVADGDLSEFAERLEFVGKLARALPAEMKILLHGADVFTYSWELIGFEEMCLKSIEEPQLVEAVMESMAAAQLNALRAAVEVAGPALGVVFYSDDIAYTEGLMLGPDFFRRHLFPVVRQVAQIAETHGAPLIYHSDGRLYDVFDDLAASGVRGIQPLEPKSMDPLRIQRDWPGKFCLIGNIDLDLMSRGTPEAVESQVREKIARLNARGGYMPGVSNTVPYYVQYENYVRMIQTIQSLPDGEVEIVAGQDRK